MPPVSRERIWYSTPEVSAVLPPTSQVSSSAVSAASGSRMLLTPTMEWKIHLGSSGVPNMPAGARRYSSVGKSPPPHSAGRSAYVGHWYMGQ